MMELTKPMKRPAWQDCMHLEGLYVVRNEDTLLWPKDFPEELPSIRALGRDKWEKRYTTFDEKGRAIPPRTEYVPHVVDFDNPLEKRWCAGQAYKLRPLTEEERETLTCASAITHPSAIAEMAYHGFEVPRPAAPPTKEERIDKNKADAGQPDRPAQSIRPKTTSRKEA